MTVEELVDKHWDIWLLSFKDSLAKNHTKLSIRFTIEALEEILEIEVDGCGCGGANIIFSGVESKIQELKQYLDEKV